MMIPPEMKDPKGISLRVVYSSADVSERKLPAAMENASTKMRIMPVRRMVLRDTPAAAIPERSPTVETKLSSTPKIKLRTYMVKNLESFFFMK